MASPRFHPLTVRSVRPETRDAIAVTFDLPESLRADYTYVPGQYLTLRTTIDGEELRRSYSICASGQEQLLRVGIKRVADGRFSNWAAEHLRPGSVIDVMTPEGQFQLPQSPDGGRHVVAFACGSGITPVLAIVKTELLAHQDTRVTLVYGNRSSGHVMFKEELEDLKDRFLGRLNLVWIMSRETQDIALFNGHIDRDKCDALLERWIDPRSIDAACVCGPMDMMQAVRASLQAHGVEPARIRMELFGTPDAAGVAPRARAPSAGASQCEVEVVQDGTRRSFRMDKNKDNLVQAGLAAGLEMPYACRGGVCSTCRALVVEGEVDMDINFALEDYEVARGFVLCCQSYPLSDRLVIDFDRDHAHS